MIIDVSSNCGPSAEALAGAGVRTVFRYYSRDTIRASKRLSASEAKALARAGLRIAVVYEGRYGDKVTNFDRPTGLADAAYAHAYGMETIGQPPGSAVYFAVDFDATAREIRERIVPYFQGVAEGFGNEAAYLVGVYGSGACCKAVLDAGLAKFAWLAQATGWRGYRAFEKSGRWALKQSMPTSVAHVGCDTNEPGADADFGDFSLPLAPAETTASTRVAMLVNARSGLRLRAGPGTDFESLRLLPLDTRVYPLRMADGWCLVDIEGDGRADGYVSSGYLIDAGRRSEIAAPGAGTDAARVPELIRLGRSAAGLKTARETAARSLPGYPTNGCAAHLSALLQLAGIAVPMTWGAGKLAHRIEQRGWQRVAPGGQAAGDVGVCFDNDPTPPGADHVYLVVEARGPDEMLVADNQRSADEPHRRYASGRGGKTPTEYFLRAR